MIRNACSRRLLATLVLTAVTLIVGCSEERNGSAGCDLPRSIPGEYEGLNVVGDVEQKYWVVVPESYEEAAPSPLYLVLAIGGGNPDAHLSLWRPYVDEETPGLHVIASTEQDGEADPQTLRTLVAAVNNAYCVDVDRVHVLGASRSAPMASEFACEASDLVASFFSGIGPTDPTGCTPGRAVPMLSITGDPERNEEVLPGVAVWAGFNGCNPEPRTKDLGSGVRIRSYEGCDADVLLYDIAGMGHELPMNDCSGLLGCAKYAEVDTVEVFESFFSEHPMP